MPWGSSIQRGTFRKFSRYRIMNCLVESHVIIPFPGSGLPKILETSCKSVVFPFPVEVIARFNPFKKFGPRVGRTQGSPLPMQLCREKRKSGGGFWFFGALEFSAYLWYIFTLKQKFSPNRNCPEKAVFL
jgi:hypothetical protein